MLKNNLILVVEDEPEVSEIIYWSLFAAGYRITLANDGLDALQMFDQDEPAAVTVDLNVPTISGYRLIELFKRLRPEVPVFVVTAADFEEAEDAVRAGVDGFFTKPFDPSLLLRQIEDRLSRKSVEAPREPELV